MPDSPTSLTEAEGEGMREGEKFRTLCPSMLRLTWQGDGYTMPASKSVTAEHLCEKGIEHSGDHAARVNDQLVSWIADG